MCQCQCQPKRSFCRPSVRRDRGLTNLEVAVEVTVSGSGTEEFTLLVNGSAYSTKTVDFEAE